MRIAPGALAFCALAFCALAFCALLAGCGSAPRARRVGTLSARRAPSERPEASPCERLTHAAGPRVCAIATLDESSSIMQVRLRLEPGALPAARREVTLRFHESEGETIEHEGGPPEGLGALPAPVELTYRVRLDGPRRPLSSWARPGGFHVTGVSLLPEILVDGAPVAVPATLALEVGEALLTTSAGTEPRVFDAADLRRLAAESYEIGPLISTRREVRSTALVIATSVLDSEETLERTADELARAIEALSARLGPPPTDAVLIVFHAEEETPDEASAPPVLERLGNALVHGGGLPQDPLLALAGGSMHELGHLWIPGSHSVREAWLAEGMTDYIAVLALEDLTGATHAERARLLLRRHARYEAGAEGRTLMAPMDDRGWVEDAGLLAGFCLDAHLVESGSGLPAVLQTTLARDEEELGIEALLEDLASVSGEVASHLEALAMRPGAFTLDGCLERFGFHVRRVSYEGFGDAALQRDVLGGVSEVRAIDDAMGLEVGLALEGSELEVGDVVLRVADHAVGALEDVAFALRATEEGALVEIVYRRAGEPRVLERARPALAAEDTVTRTSLEVLAVEEPRVEAPREGASR